MEILRQRLERAHPISDEMWEAICAQLKMVSLRKGASLLKAGEVCRHLYYLRQGLLRMYYLKEGEEHIRQFFFENGLTTDLMSALTGEPSRLHFDALEDTEVVLIPIELMHRFPLFKEKALTDNLFHVSNRMASIFLDSPEEKYRQLLAERPKVIQRIPQYMIAAYIGVTPEGLSRIKRRMHRHKGEK
jgi:CRP/FNR family transcriptional regulator, anaerobic regulatory protein